MTGGKKPGPIIDVADSKGPVGGLRQVLGAGFAPGPLGVKASGQASAQGSTTYKHPVSLKVRLALFWLTNYGGQTDQGVLQRAEDMLKEHGLGLDVWPSRTRIDQTTLPFKDRLVEREDYESLRSSAEDLLSRSAQSNRLIVVFCQFRFPANGLTISDSPTQCWTRPICLVGPTVASDQVTLHHELGHAAGLDHDHTSTDARKRNFMHESETRTTMYRWQIEKMAQAFFLGP